MTAKMPWDGDISHTKLPDGRVVLRGSPEEAEHIGNHSWELPKASQTIESAKLHGDDVSAPYIRGIGVYTNGTIEISNEHIDYTILKIGEWRAMNGRVEELAKLAGV